MRAALMPLLLASAMLAGAAPTAVLAKAPAAKAVPAPVRELAPVPLRAAVPEQEQWEERPVEGKGVRNVVNPTLIPVLPARDKANGLAVIVAPGGGFVNLAFDNEGVRVAHYLAEQGIAAFVLKYRVRATPRDEAEYRAFMMQMMSGAEGAKGITTPQEAVDDASAAVRLVRARAGEWRVDPAKVGLIGFSAGAMTTLGAGLVEDRAARPDFIAPIYGPRDPGPVPADAPPMFLAIALDDPLFKPEATLGLIDGWRKAGRPLEVHLYERGGHGFGMRQRSAATGLWPSEFVAWMKDRGLFLPPAERRTYELKGMKVGAMLDNPAMRAVLAKHQPALVEGSGSGMMRGLTIGDVAAFAPQVLPPDKLAAILADLAALP